MNGKQVSGFVDCDHLSVGPRVFDIADFIVHMIKQHVADGRRTSEWFDLFPAVLQGYQAENALSEVEKGALYYVMLGVLLLFADWFIRAGDFQRTQIELNAFAWMVHHRQKICTRIVAV